MPSTPAERPGRDRRAGFGRILGRALLLLYPRPFRLRYGEEILDALDERFRDSASSGRFTLVRAVLDITRSALAERARPTLRSNGRRRSAGIGAVDAALLDVRQALRSLAARPGYALVVALTLAVALGASTAIFSVVHGVLWRALPYPAAERLVTVTRSEPHRGLSEASMSLPDVEDLRRSADTLTDLVAYTITSLTETGGERAHVLAGARTTGGLLRAFGLAPDLGRDLDAADARPGSPPRVVVAWSLWQERLGGEPRAIGRSLELDGLPHEIVGVAPRGFDFPEGSELWVASLRDLEDCDRDCHYLRTVGRMATGTTLEAAQEQVDTIAGSLREAYPEANFGKEFVVEGLREAIVGEVRQGLLVLLGAVLCVLLIATANVGNLTLVQGIERRDELALRAALGAGGSRLVRLLLAEAALLAAVGGALGVGLAVGATRVLVRLAPSSPPRLDAVRIDGGVLLFAFGLSLASVVLFGLIPAVRLVLHFDGRSLVVSSRVAGRGPERTRSFLLLVEVALSLVLLVAAGLLGRNLQELLDVRLGFDPEDVVSAFLALPESRYGEPQEVAGFYRELEQRLATLPGVTSVGSILGPPFGRNQVSTSVQFDDRPAPPSGQEESVILKIVTPGYFETLGIPLLAGRPLEVSDHHDARAVALVNEAFVRRYGRKEGTIGSTFALGLDFGWEHEDFEVVGVVGDARSSLVGKAAPEIYVAEEQMPSPWLTVLVRTAPGTQLLPALEEELASLDPDLPMRRVEPMTRKIERQRVPSLLYLTLVGAFAAVALLLAALGLYGVVAYVVSRRRREIAIRMAVGADRRRILGLVLRQGMVPVLAGLGVGLAASFLVRRFLDSLLFNVAAIEGPVVAGVSLLVLGVALAAMAVPALEASRLAPARALVDE